MNEDESKNLSDSVRSKISEKNYEEKSYEEEEEEEDEEKGEQKDKLEQLQKFSEIYNKPTNPEEISRQKIFFNKFFNIDDETFLTIINKAGANKSIQNNNLRTLFKNNLNYKGWKIRIKGSIFLSFGLNTFELFEYLTDVISNNLRLDDLLIYNEFNTDTFEGGKFFFLLKNYLEEFLNPKNEQIEPVDQMAFIQLFNKYNQLNYFCNNNINNNDSDISKELNYYTCGQSNYDNNDINVFGVSGYI